VKTWCLSPAGDADFVYHMEDVLQVYQLPYDPERPVICMDEASKQLIGETRVPLPTEPGAPLREDYEYERFGVVSEFVFVQPLRGWRHVIVTDRRTKRDWALCIQDLLDRQFPDVKCVRLVLDNLNTHTGAALYETFAPDEARRLLDRLEFHYTPKHASWLNMAEIEIGVMNRQCLDRRIPEKETVCHEVAAWEQRRNDEEAKIRWTFTVSAARVKLERVYPSIEG
jgi:hypothetical protein